MWDSKLTERKRGFPAKVMRGGKITIPHEIRELLDINTGDMVDIFDIQKAKPSK